MLSRFARNEMTRPHFFFSMPEESGAKADAAEHIHFEEAQPIESGFRGRFGFENPKLLTTMSASGTFFRKASTPA